MAQERVYARDGFGGVKGGGARRNAVRRERGLSGIRNGLLRERVRQRLERRLVFQREVHALVGFDEHQNFRGWAARIRSDWAGRRSRVRGSIFGSRGGWRIGCGMGT